jgi:competence protein ComGC
MDTSNIIAIVLGGSGFIISIIGLIATPHINKKTKRLEKQLECRLQLFEKCIELWEYTHSKNTEDNSIFIDLMSDINKLIQLYGHNNEIYKFRIAGKNYNNYVNNKTEKNYKDFMEAMNDFCVLNVTTFRKELGFQTIKDKVLV